MNSITLIENFPCFFRVSLVKEKFRFIVGECGEITGRINVETSAIATNHLRNVGRLAFSAQDTRDDSGPVESPYFPVVGAETKLVLQLIRVCFMYKCTQGMKEMAGLCSIAKALNSNDRK